MSSTTPTILVVFILTAYTQGGQYDDYIVHHTPTFEIELEFCIILYTDLVYLSQSSVVRGF